MRFSIFLPLLMAIAACGSNKGLVVKESLPVVASVASDSNPGSFDPVTGAPVSTGGPIGSTVPGVPVNQGGATVIGGIITAVAIAERSIPIHACPSLGAGTLGGGAWGYYGCKNQLTPEASCATIEYPRSRIDACQRVGDLRVALQDYPTGASQDVYVCPSIPAGSLGGGAWGFYGCQGQLTPSSVCQTIEYPSSQTHQCNYVGKLNLHASAGPGTRPMYRCPTLGGGSLGGGAWGFYGCQGQLTEETTCATIEWPRSRTDACVFAGHLRVY